MSVSPGSSGDSHVKTSFFACNFSNIEFEEYVFLELHTTSDDVTCDSPDEPCTMCTECVLFSSGSDFI